MTPNEWQARAQASLIEARAARAKVQTRSQARRFSALVISLALIGAALAVVLVL